MPSRTWTVTPESFAEIVAALDAEGKREEGDTDAQMVERYIKSPVADLLYRHRRKVKAAEVVYDDSIVTVEDV